MSKIICDICGTSYAETAKQCPICGCVRPGDVQRVTNEVRTDGNVSTGYTYVKGGRFSKRNVKKRTYEQKRATVAAKKAAPKDSGGEDKTSIGLVITAVVLLLAIIGVVIYIAVRFFGPFSAPSDATTLPTGTVGQSDLSCTDIKLEADTLLFEAVGEARLLSVTVEPKNTSDSLSFRSENDQIATVTKDGKITAVSEGTTTIYVTCGKLTKEVTVTCQVATESVSTDPTIDTTVTEPSKPAVTLTLNRKDMTLKSKGDSWVLYSGEIAKNLITWTSDDEKVATFADGKVVAVGAGMTQVHATYEDQKVSCIVRCSFEESSGVGGNGGVSEDGGGIGGNGDVSEDGGSGAVTGTVNVRETLRVRGGPGTNYDVVGTLYPNDRVTITERKTVDGMEWGKISTGWISLDYVVLD